MIRRKKNKQKQRKFIFNIHISCHCGGCTESSKDLFGSRQKHCWVCSLLRLFFSFSSHLPLTFLSPSSLRYFIPKEDSADKKDAKSKTSEETKEAATEQTDKVYTFLFPFHLSPLLSSRSLLLFSLEYSFIYQEGDIERIMEGLSVEQSVSSESLAARIIDTSPLEGLRYKKINTQVGKEDKREKEREREEKQEKKNE